jgi:hypothetical protein
MDASSAKASNFFQFFIRNEFKKVCVFNLGAFQTPVLTQQYAQSFSITEMFSPYCRKARAVMKNRPQKYTY